MSKRYSTARPAPLPRGGFSLEQKAAVDKYAPKMSAMTQDFLFRNIYKSPFQRKPSTREEFDSSRNHRNKSLRKKKGLKPLKSSKFEDDDGPTKPIVGKLTESDIESLETLSDGEEDWRKMELEGSDDDSSLDESSKKSRKKSQSAKQAIPFFDGASESDNEEDDWMQPKKKSKKKQSKMELSKSEDLNTKAFLDDDNDEGSESDNEDSDDSSSLDDDIQAENTLFSDSEEPGSKKKFKSKEQRQRYMKRKMIKESRWLATKLREHKDVFKGGLNIQGIVPPLKGGCLGSHPEIRSGALLMGCVVRVFDQFLQLTVYGGATAYLTLREVSDLMSDELDRLSKEQARLSSLNRKSLAQMAEQLGSKTARSASSAAAVAEAEQSGGMDFGPGSLSTAVFQPKSVYPTIDDLPSMTELFKIGQMLRFAVVRRSQSSSNNSTNNGKRRISSSDGSEKSSILRRKRPSVTDGSRDGIYVSIRPSVFNDLLRLKDLCVGYPLLCTVISREDHGYIVDCGITGVRCFLRYCDCPTRYDLSMDIDDDGDEQSEQEVEDEIIDDEKLKHTLIIGHTMDLTVSKVDRSSGSVWVSMKPLSEIVTKTTAQEWADDFLALEKEKHQSDNDDDNSEEEDNSDELLIDDKSGQVIKATKFENFPKVPLVALKPGFGVIGKIVQRVGDGVVIDFGEVYRGIVMYSHIPGMLEREWKKTIKVGSKVAARVIMVDRTDNVIHLSLKPHLVYGMNPNNPRQLSIEWSKQSETLSNEDEMMVKPSDLRPPLILKTGMIYGINVPKLGNEVITGDVRRIAYTSLLLWSPKLDPRNRDAKEEFSPGEDTDSSSNTTQTTLDDNVNHGLILERSFHVPCTIPVRVRAQHLRLKSDDIENGELKTTSNNNNNNNYSSSIVNSLMTYKNRTELQMKILRFNPFEGEYLATMRDDLIQQKVLFYWQIKAGMLFEDCVIVEINRDELVVSFAHGLYGRIGRLHVSEIPPKNDVDLSDRFKLGMKLTCRVLNSYTKIRHINLTAKPSLTTEDGNVNNNDNNEIVIDGDTISTMTSNSGITIGSYNGLRKGQVSKAVVCRMNDSMGYIIVHFFNNVMGLVPRYDLRSNMYLKSPSEEFYIGQTISVKVTNIDNRQNRRLICSMNLNPDLQAQNGDGGSSSNQSDKIGRYYWTRIVARFDSCFVLRRVRHRREDEGWMDANDDAGFDEMSESDESDSDNDEGNSEDDSDGSDYSSSSSNIDSDDSQASEKRRERRERRREKKMAKKMKRKKRKQLIILPFTHLSDDAACSLRLADDNLGLFKIGSRFPVLSITKLGNIGSPMPRKVLLNMLSVCGISESELNVAFDSITDVVSVKPTLMKEFRDGTIERSFPAKLDANDIQVGQILVGFLSMYEPTRKNGVWMHLRGAIQIPIKWSQISDLTVTETRKCVNQSWKNKLRKPSDVQIVDDESDNDSDDDLSDNEEEEKGTDNQMKKKNKKKKVSMKEIPLWKPGDLVYAKVVSVESVESGPGEIDAFGQALPPKTRVEVSLRHSVMQPIERIVKMNSCRVFMKNLMLLRKLQFRHFLKNVRHLALEECYESKLKELDDESEDMLSKSEQREISQRVTQDLKVAYTGLSHGELVECVITQIEEAQKQQQKTESSYSMKKNHHRVCLEMKRSVSAPSKDGLRNRVISSRLVGLTGVLSVSVSEGNSDGLSRYQSLMQSQEKVICSIVYIDWAEKLAYLSESPISKSESTGGKEKKSKKKKPKSQDSLQKGQQVSARIVHLNQADDRGQPEFVILLASMMSMATKKVTKFAAVAPMKLPYLNLPSSLLFGEGDFVTCQVLAPDVHGFALVEFDWQKDLEWRIRRMNGRVSRALRGLSETNRRFSTTNRNAFTDALDAERVQHVSVSSNDGIEFPYSVRPCAEDLDVDMDEVTDKKSINEDDDWELTEELKKKLKRRIISSALKAKVLSFDESKQSFRIFVSSKPSFYGYLPMSHLSDCVSMSKKFANVIRDILDLQQKSNLDESIMMMPNLDVTILRVTNDNNNVIVTAKPMFVELAKNNSWPRYNALHCPHSYQCLKRTVPLLGYVDGSSEMNGDFNVRFSGETKATMPFDRCIKAPFTDSHIQDSLNDGETVVCSLSNVTRVDKSSYDVSVYHDLSDLPSMERDIICTNTMFWNHQKFLSSLIQLRQSMKNEKVSQRFHIGQRIQACVMSILPNEVRLKPEWIGKKQSSDVTQESLVIYVRRPEHSGMLSQLKIGKMISCVILDIDDYSGRIEGSIRMAYPSAIETDISMNDKPKDPSVTLAMIEHVSMENGYLLCRSLDCNKDGISPPKLLLMVPVKIPYLRMPSERLRWYFPLGSVLELCMDEKLTLDDDDSNSNDGYSMMMNLDINNDGESGLKVFDHESSMQVHSAHINDLNKYLSQKSDVLIRDDSDIPRPFDTRFSCVSDIITLLKNGVNVNNLRCKVLISDLKNHLGLSLEIANDYPNTRICVTVNSSESNKSKSKLKMKQKKKEMKLLEKLSKKEFIFVHLRKDHLIWPETHLSWPIGLSVNADSECVSTEKDTTKSDSSEVRELCDSSRSTSNIGGKIGKRKRKLSVMEAESKIATKMEWMGRKVIAKVVKIVPDYGLFLAMDGFDGRCTMHITNCKPWKSDRAMTRIDLNSMFAVGHALECRVIAVDSGMNSSQTRRKTLAGSQSSDASQTRLELSVRHLLNPDSEAEVRSLESLSVGTEVSGLVQSMEPRMGVIMWISRFLKAVIPAEYLSGQLGMKQRNELASVFRVGTVLRSMRVSSVNPQSGRVALHLNPAELSGKRVKDGSSAARISLVKGDFIRVRFSGMSQDEQRAKVYIPRTPFRGYIPISSLKEDLQPSMMIPGDWIKAWVRDCSNPRRIEFSMIRVKSDSETMRVLSVEEKRTLAKQRALLRMQSELAATQKELDASEFARMVAEDAELSEEEPQTSEEDNDSDFEPLMIAGINDSKEEMQQAQDRAEVVLEEVDAFIDDDPSVRVEMTEETKEEDSEVDLSELQAMTDHLIRQDGAKKERSGLEDMRRDEIPTEMSEAKRRAQEERAKPKPLSVQEYEKMLIASPNSSAVWIQYAALFAKHRPEKARAILERALNTMALEEDSERMNVWSARMSLECLFGSHESLMKVFSEARRQCDEKEVMFQLCSVLENDGRKNDRAEHEYERLLSKYPRQLSAYLSYARFLYQKTKKVRKGRDLLKIALRNLLDRKSQRSVILECARLEYEYADKEHGRSLFSSLCDSDPTRLNVWKSFSLAELQFGEGSEQSRLDSARQVWDQCLSAVSERESLSLIKKAFQACLNFERAHGSRSTDHRPRVLSLKERARLMVSRMTA